jgi:DNA-binding MarR family transcriptional regulator
MKHSQMKQARPLTVTRSELLPGGTDKDFRAFVHSFMIFSRLLETIRANAAATIGVSSPQYEILIHLREATDHSGLTATQVAQRLHCSGPFVTTEVGKLHKAGLVVRHRDPLDARCVRLTLSAGCERRFRDIAFQQQEVNNVLFRSLSRRQFQILRQVFPRLVDDGDNAIALAEHQRASAIRIGKPA